MENIPINSDSINKSLDIIQESTKETRKKIDETASKGVNKLAKLFWASPLGIKADVYIAERPYKMEKALKEMKQKYEKIPIQYQVEPTSYIALKGVNELNYSLDEQHLKEMFQNLLVSDMDSRKQNKVLPSYIEIIKQLSKEDAEFLMLLKKFNGNLCSIAINVKEQNLEGYFSLDKYIIYGYDHNSISNTTTFNTSKLNQLTIDNLIMHRLLEQDYDTYYTFPTANEQYTSLFDQVKGKYKLASNQSLIYDKGLVRLTNFGKNFIDICLS